MRASHPTSPIFPGRRVTAPIGITRCRSRPKQAPLSKRGPTNVADRIFLPVKSLRSFVRSGNHTLRP
jgi:hypothetical protein